MRGLVGFVAFVGEVGCDGEEVGECDEEIYCAEG